MGRAAPVRAGDVLASKYRVERILGIGGMGVVMSALHLQLGQRVAVKFVRPEKATDPETVERFAREARAVVQLRSEHVARILDVGELDGGSPYIVMEYLEGTDLATMVRRDGPVSVTVAADYVVQALDALAEAHAIGIVHRDLKPSNLFVTRRSDGTAWLKVLDFGISKLGAQADVSTLTGTHSIIGSPAYMSPENLWSSKLVDARSDIWSLGIILYELVTGELPFSAPAYSTLVLKVAMAPLPSLAGKGSVAGPAEEFDALVRRCLEKEPARRFDSVAGLAAALQPFAPASAAPTVERVCKLLSEPPSPAPAASCAPALPPPTTTPAAAILSPTSSPTRTSSRRSTTRLAAPHALLAARPRGRERTWKLALTVAIAVLAAGSVAVHRLHRESHARLLRFHTEQGRQAMLSGDPMRGLVYLSEAQRAGARGPALDLLLGSATRALGGEILALHDPGRSVGMPEFSPDGRLVLTSGSDSVSQLRDATTGALVTTLRGTGPRGWTVQSAFSPDSARIAVRSDRTGQVAVWSATGELLHTLAGHSQPVTAIVHSPDGQHILTTSADASARIWGARDGAQEQVLPASAPLVVGDWSPDGRRIATGASDGTLQLWDARARRLARTWKGHRQRVQMIQFSADGALLTTASWDSSASIWDANSGVRLHSLSHDGPIDDIAFSPDGTRVVTSSQDRTARVWSVATGALLHSLEGHRGPVFVARFSRDGRRILTTGGDETARLWDARTGELSWTYPGALWSASFDASGNRVVAATVDGSARIWDARRTLHRVALRGHADGVGSARFSPDGASVLTASGDRTIRLWDAATGRQLASSAPEPTAQLFVAWSPDGARFLSIDDRVAKVWDVRSMRPVLRLVGHDAPMWSGGTAGFSPDGSKIVTGSQDRTARLWDARSGRELVRLVGHRATVNSGQFSPDGARVVTASEDGTARIWDAASGAQLLELRGHAELVTAAVFDRAGNRVLTTSGDRTAKIWDARWGALLATLEGHTHQVNRSDFHPDGALVVTSSIDGTARLWDAQDGRTLGTFPQPWIGEASFSPDGERILTASRDGTAKIWQLAGGSATSDELERLIRCRIPFRIEGDHLAAARTDPRLCRGLR
jgi:WD40 repeat protein/serine/threonine protein kinase